MYQCSSHRVTLVHHCLSALLKHIQSCVSPYNRPHPHQAILVHWACSISSRLLRSNQLLARRRSLWDSQLWLKVTSWDLNSQGQWATPTSLCRHGRKRYPPESILAPLQAATLECSPRSSSIIRKTTTLQGATSDLARHKYHTLLHFTSNITRNFHSLTTCNTIPTWPPWDL